MIKSYIQNLLQEKIINHHDQIKTWFSDKIKDISFPFYSSFDLRDSSFKIAPVDANLFPAGCNNICKIDKENSEKLCRFYLQKNFPSTEYVIILAEEHTQNAFYWDNIYTLKILLEKSGYKNKVFVCVPGKNIQEEREIKSASGFVIKVHLLNDKMSRNSLIISNNDFSVDYNLNIEGKITPPVSAGWKNRRKHSFFKYYNKLAEEFARLIDLEPFFLTIQTKKFKNFDIQDKDSLNRLKESVYVFFSELEAAGRSWKKANARFSKDFSELNRPFVFLKNSVGTYGLGVTVIHSAQDIDHWNYKVKKKMKAGKGGEGVNELIIQEGIASHVKTDNFTAEPVIYLIGSALAGGFLRLHKEKGEKDNLNSPGAVYRTLCISDLEISVEGKPKENVYGWIAQLAGLALAYELQVYVSKK